MTIAEEKNATTRTRHLGTWGKSCWSVAGRERESFSRMIGPWALYAPTLDHDLGQVFHQAAPWMERSNFWTLFMWVRPTLSQWPDHSGRHTCSLGFHHTCRCDKHRLSHCEGLPRRLKNRRTLGTPQRRTENESEFRPVCGGVENVL